MEDIKGDARRVGYGSHSTDAGFVVNSCEVACSVYRGHRDYKVIKGYIGVI